MELLCSNTNTNNNDNLIIIMIMTAFENCRRFKQLRLFYIHLFLTTSCEIDIDGKKCFFVKGNKNKNVL